MVARVGYPALMTTFIIVSFVFFWDIMTLVVMIAEYLSAILMEGINAIQN